MIEIVQAPPDGTVVPQVFETWKSVELPPDVAILDTVRKELPTLVSVTVFAALILPSVWFAKVTLVGASAICGVLMPLAESAVQVFVPVQPSRFEPGLAVVTKNN